MIFNDSDFAKELKQLINKHSIENESNTPDWILAEYVVSCLNTFTATSKTREIWYGRPMKIEMPDVAACPYVEEKSK